MWLLIRQYVRQRHDIRRVTRGHECQVSAAIGVIDEDGQPCGAAREDVVDAAGDLGS